MNGGLARRFSGWLQTVALLLISLNVAADSYWLIGSFNDRSDAISAAQQISADTGLDVYLQGSGSRYRIMTGVADNQPDRQAMRAQLMAAGVTDIYMLTYDQKKPSLMLVNPPMMTTEADLPAEDPVARVPAGGTSGDLDEFDDIDLAEIDAMLNDYDEDMTGEASYLVVGSFLDTEKADEVVISINITGYNVIVRSAMVNGSQYHRVLVGPVSDSDEVDVRQKLSALGFDGVWILRGIPDSAYLFDFDDELMDLDGEPVIERSAIPSRPGRDEPVKYPGEDSDYNLARLKDS